MGRGGLFAAIQSVVAGLVPAIHVYQAGLRCVDARHSATAVRFTGGRECRFPLPGGDCCESSFVVTRLEHKRFGGVR